MTDSYIWMPEEATTIRRTDVEPGFASDADYRRWADRASGALIIEKGLVDLEDALSVLALMHRLRHMAETDDRRYFALNPEATLRQRLAYPGEGWELMRHAEDRPEHCLVPAVLVTRSQTGSLRHLFLHPEAFEIGRTRRGSSARHLPPPNSRTWSMSRGTTASDGSSTGSTSRDGARARPLT